MFNITVTYQSLAPRLVLEVTSDIQPTHSVLYTVPLAELYPIELLLNDGRFLHFEREQQAITIENVITAYDPVAMEYFTSRLNWLATNVYNTWSVRMTMRHVGCSVYVWSFENQDDAILFRLTF